MYRRISFAFAVLFALLTRAAGADTPPSNLPSNTPASYDLTVQVVGQAESEWCWATSAKMVIEYFSPLPRINECDEANYHTSSTVCCADGSSPTCDKGGPLNPLPIYPISYHDTVYGTPLTFDQIKYQIWVKNSPVGFAWHWIPKGGHVMVLTGYATDSSGNQYVWVNNPEPVGKGSTELIPYSEFCQDTSPGDPYGRHTHQSDCWGYQFTGNELIFNLPPRATEITLPITAAQASDLNCTVVSDRTVPFTIKSGNKKATGTVQEQVCKERRTGTLDFYYRITNDSGSQGVISSVKVSDFAGFTTAAAYRTDGLGDLPALSATRGPAAHAITINAAPIPAKLSSKFIFLMTDAKSSNDTGKLIVRAAFAGSSTLRQTTIATDEPTE